MGIRKWFSDNIPIPESGNAYIARSICDKLIPLEKEIREKAYYKICNSPDFKDGVKKILIEKHKEHIIYG